MNALVVYESGFGNTATIAHAIADALATYGNVRLCAPDEMPDPVPQEIELVVVGCPTQRHMTSPGMTALLGRLGADTLRGRAVAAFDTRYRMLRILSGSAAHRMLPRLRHAGGRPVGRPESFFVVGREGPLETGEVERASAWAHQLAAEVAAA